jgi:hypothetical protein
VEEKIAHSESENYEEYIKSFINTKKTFYRKIPNMRGVKDFDFVDEGSNDNMLTGYSVKYCVRAHVMLLRDLVKEIQTNPNASYQTCYTKDEIISGDFPEYFSVFMKETDTDYAIGSEVFASRLLNYFGTPVAYNRRIDKGSPYYGTTKYVMSVDMIGRNEKLVLLSDIIPFRTHIDIRKFEIQGLKETLDFVGQYLESYLDQEGVEYTENEIEDYKKFLAVSLLERYMFLGDTDFRNGNSGILIDLKKNKFRPLPNFDMEKSFSSLASSRRFGSLIEFYDLYPDEYDKFIHKMLGLFEGTKKGSAVCIDLAKKAIREDAVASSVLYQMSNSAEEIWNETVKFKKNLEANEDNEKGYDNLA